MRSLLIVLACALSVGPALAGAWTMPAGATFQRFDFRLFESSSSFDTDGDEIDLLFGGEFRHSSIGWYQEWGLTSKWTLTSTMSFAELEFNNQFLDLDENGLADIELGIKRLLLSGPTTLSVMASVKAPGPYDEEDFLALGSGQWDTELRLLAGWSWPAFLKGGYAGAEIGYRARAEEPADEIRTLLEVGANASRRLSLRLALASLLSAGDGEPVSIGANTTLTNESDLHLFEATASWSLDHRWSVELSWTENLAGVNIAAGSGAALALSLSLP